MANLHSTMRRGRGNTVSSTANDYAETMVETWQVRITTTLFAHGFYSITITDRETDALLDYYEGQYPISEYLTQVAREQIAREQAEAERETEREAQAERDY